jgi:deoxyribodipyrimidine photo-lyase
MILVWHRADLRLHDHPALNEAATRGGAVAPCFVLDPSLLNMPYSGKPRIAFLHANLRALNEAYETLGSGLVLRAGKPEEELLKLARESGATAVYALRSYEPVGRERDERVKKVLEANGVEFRVLAGDCIFEPGLIRSGSGGSYRVFTPFWRNWSAQALPVPLPVPKTLAPHKLTSLEFPAPQTKLDLPPAGEAAAFERLSAFLRDVGLQYEYQRNLPAIDGTSRLSMYLHLGVISPRTAAARATRAGMTAWVRELCWRDYYRHILWDEPRLALEAFKPAWQGFPFRDAPDDLAAWREGMTGYPIVDAGMRQLETTGWMHNRVRMIVASFLTKHLMIHYQHGETVFNERLLDGDEAANNGGWQWVTGCGVDAAPYFRVFNPVSQGEKFDVDAQYLKRFVPELEGLSVKEAHQPWTSLKPPKDYPAPMTSLNSGRERFLETARRHLKGQGAPEE